MKCPICGNDTKVIDVRHDCESTGRKRECKTCGHRFYTMERDCPIGEFLELEHRAGKKRSQKSTGGQIK